MTQEYFETKFSIGDRSTASFLQNLNNWKIVEAIMEAGTQGITSQELSKKLRISYNVVAATTRQLAQMNWITSEPRKPRVGRPRVDRPEFTKPPNLHVWDAMDSLTPEIEDGFRDYCFKVFDEHAADLKGFVRVLDNVILEMKSSGKFYPREPIHDECGWSHEGWAFVRGLLYAFAEWLDSDGDFQAVVTKHKIAEDKAFQEEAD